MKTLVSLALATTCVLVAAPAGADDYVLGRTLNKQAVLVTKLADPVVVAGVAFYDAKCEARFGTPTKVAGDDREVLALCISGLALQTGTLPGTWTSTARHGRDDGAIAITVTVADDKITAFGPASVDAKGREANLPTTFITPMDVRYTPTTQVQAKLDAAGHGVSVVLKVCLDAAGAASAPRTVTASPIRALDTEVTALVAKRSWKPFALGGKASAACALVVVEAWPSHGDENGEEGGVEGGMVGGDVSGVVGTPPPPPPPPPPTSPPQIVPPAVLEHSRLTGTADIVPDAATITEIERSGKDKVIGSFKMCVDVNGAVSSVSKLKSTTFAAYDAKLMAAMQTWTYTPYVVNGKPIAVCTAITFIYSRK